MMAVVEYGRSKVIAAEKPEGEEEWSLGVGGLTPNVQDMFVKGSVGEVGKS